LFLVLGLSGPNLERYSSICLVVFSSRLLVFPVAISEMILLYPFLNSSGATLPFSPDISHVSVWKAIRRPEQGKGGGASVAGNDFLSRRAARPAGTMVVDILGRGLASATGERFGWVQRQQGQQRSDDQAAANSGFQG